MFDDLDDPAAPAPGPVQRAAVAARATRLKRRRMAALAGGGTSVALAVALVAYAASGGSPRSLDVVAESPSPSPTAEGTPAEPSYAPDPTPTSVPPSPASPGPSRTAAPPSPSPTASEDSEGFRWNSPDGKPGWSSGFSGCHHPDGLPEPGTAPFPELEMELVVPATLRAGQTHDAHLLLRNTGDRYLRFMVSGFDHDAYVVDSRGNSGGKMWSDAVAITPYELAPGETRTIPVTVNTWACGDTSADPRAPLPAGAYTVTATMSWSSRSTYVPPSPAPSSSPEPTLLPGPGESPSPEPTPTPTPSYGEPDRAYGDWSAPRITVRVE